MAVGRWPLMRWAFGVETLGVEALTVQADIGNPEAVAELVRAVEAAFGGVDILVNSASPFIRGQLHDTTLEQWHFVLGALLDGPFLLCQAFAPGMMTRGAGLIVNRNPVPGHHGDSGIDGGLRLGTPAITARGMKEPEVGIIVQCIDAVLKHFDHEETLASVKNDIAALCRRFPLHY